MLNLPAPGPTEPTPASAEDDQPQFTSKSAACRALYRQGYAQHEIVKMGYNKHTVSYALKSLRGGGKMYNKERLDQIHALVTEVLREVRGLKGSPTSIIDRLADG